MPIKPKRPCSYPGCPKLATGDDRHCPEHRRKVEQQVDKARGTAAQRGYGHRWSRIRLMKLNADPLCERCELAGRDVPAVLVHHKDRNSKNNINGNLESLCDRCHDLEHAKDIYKPRGEGRPKSLETAGK